MFKLSIEDINSSAWTDENDVRRPMVWCFCTFDDCNISIDKLNQTDYDVTPAPATPPPAPDDEDSDEDNLVDGEC